MSLAPKRKAARPFVVDLPAPLLKRNAKLSRSARMLYLTMRSLANGKTGELAIRGNPLDWRYIAKQAEIGRNVWQRCLKELMAAGYVSREREVVEHYKDGRKRIVWGRAHYFAHRQPKTMKKAIILPMPVSCTVEERGTQDFTEAPSSARRGFVGSESDSLKRESVLNHHHRDTADDDGASPVPLLPASEEPNRIEALQDRAIEILIARGEDRETVKVAIEMLEERAASLGKMPASPKYYVACFETLKANNEEWFLVRSKVSAMKARREKFMPGFTGKLTPKREARRKKFNALHKDRA